MEVELCKLGLVSMSHKMPVNKFYQRYRGVIGSAISTPTRTGSRPPLPVGCTGRLARGFRPHACSNPVSR